MAEIRLQLARSEFILGGQKSGKSRRAEVRAFVDALGTLNQDVACVCQRVTLMAAGLPLILKDT